MTTHIVRRNADGRYEVINEAGVVVAVRRTAGLAELAARAADAREGWTGTTTWIQ